MKNWSIYFNKHKQRKSREQTLRAILLCKVKEVALDLGAGNLIESKALLDAGFKKVVAVDNAPEAKEFVKDINDNRLEFRSTSFQEVDFITNEFDLINAEFALPFFGKEGFEDFFAKIKDSLKVGGVFTGQLFGERDGWNTPDSDLVFHTKNEAMSLLRGLQIIEFVEEEKDSSTVSGVAKHWHIFRFIAKR